MGMINLVGNVCLLVAPVLLLSPQLMRKRSTLPPTLSIITIAAALYRIPYFLIRKKVVGDAFNIALFLQSFVVLSLHAFLLKYKKSNISILEERIIFTLRAQYGKIEIEKIVGGVLSFISALNFSIILLLSNKFTMNLLCLISIILEISCLLVYIMIMRIEKKSCLNLKSFKNIRIIDRMSYKLNALGESVRMLWLLYIGTPYILVFSSLILAMLNLIVSLY